MTISERIARNAKYLCRKQGKKLSDLETSIGVSQGYLSRIRGRSIMPIDKCTAIAEWLGVDLEKMIYFDLQKEDKILRLEAALKALKEERDDQERLAKRFEERR